MRIFFFATIGFLPAIRLTYADSLSVDTSSYQASYDFYHNYYLPSANVAPGWTGNHNSCSAGTLSATFLQATLQRINYFRAMAGLNADITLDSTLNQYAQEASLIFSVNDILTHTPPSSATCYTANGYTGANKSDITQNAIGAEAVDVFIKDDGFGNTAVGHRRWLLYPGQQTMGVGSVPKKSDTQPSAAAIYVLAPFATRKQAVAWPPAGYVPWNIVYQRWSYSRSKADFSNATIHVTVNGVRTEFPKQTLESGYGDNTVVFAPNVLFPPPDLATYTVEIDNFFVPESPGVAQHVTYDVKIFKPTVPPPNGSYPTVTSIVRNQTASTNAASVSFTVTFSESVSGVDVGDFQLATSGVTGATIASVSADSGSTRTVTINTGMGDGSLQLNLVDNDSIVDATASPLGGVGTGNGNFSVGQSYSIDKSPPTVAAPSLIVP